MERTRHPGIYRRGSRYVVVWRHRGKQHKSYHRTLAEAREAQGQRRQPDQRKPATREPFEDYARRWVDAYQGRTSSGFSETTRREYRRAMLDHALPYFRRYRLADVEPRDVKDYARHLADKGLSPASVKKYLGPLKAMLAEAFEDGALRVNPAAGVRVNTRSDATEEVEAKSMKRAELGRLLGKLPADWRLFFELLAHTGLRISEALGLDWSDVRFGEQPRLRVRRQFYRGELRQLKTRNARRDLPLSPGLSRRLWAARPANAEGPIFATGNGTRYSERNVRKVLDRTMKDTDLAWVHFHTFRHTCASMLFEGGKNVAQVAAWLGHADPAFTLRTYVHLLDGGLGDADFLDVAVRVGNVGNGWATQDPEKAASADSTSDLESALQGGFLDQPQVAVSPGAS